MYRYWTKDDIKKIQKADSFDDLVLIALNILKRMSLIDKSIVQISGPMTTGGLNNLRDNFNRLNGAIIKLESFGFMVFNQIPFEDPLRKISQKFSTNKKNYCFSILNIFYKKLFKSGYIKTIFFLPDWRSSKGATWERKLALNLGLDVQEYPKDLLLLFD